MKPLSPENATGNYWQDASLDEIRAELDAMEAQIDDAARLDLTPEPFDEERYALLWADVYVAYQHAYRRMVQDGGAP